ncbi:AraC family transcriptional regulator [Desulfallas sp. Bu1-1]|jgi:NAD-dependent SIR2 family protein deacetylase|uniref:CD1247 N-terminal domain-containing protein n=1 Tax=Desulfallas sp. Bu1-1 TaxID=2787620 RepID=UPI00189D1FAD|nr:CD1247 N-terminal domain-containing protein [Desulfallas sp. Bu1-1]MBF7082109.1 AraC family transcriptional regulator [Desulfallas sp. Bu1-1]
MSDLRSKVAYLQGLSNGLNLDAESKEGKILNGIIDVLGEIAESFTELEDAHEQLEDYVETIDEDLYSLESELNDEDELGEYVEVDCPRCGETVLFDPGIIEDDDVIEVTCPNCDEVVFVNDDNYESADESENLEARIESVDDDI